MLIPLTTRLSRDQCIFMRRHVRLLWWELLHLSVSKFFFIHRYIDVLSRDGACAYTLVTKGYASRRSWSHRNNETPAV